MVKNFLQILSHWSSESVKKWMSYASAEFWADIFKVDVTGALNVTKIC